MKRLSIIDKLKQNFNSISNSSSSSISGSGSGSGSGTGSNKSNESSLNNSCSFNDDKISVSIENTSNNVHNINEDEQQINKKNEIKSTIDENEKDEKENKVPQIKMRIKKQQNNNYSTNPLNRFSALVTSSLTFSNNTNNKRYSADITNKELLCTYKIALMGNAEVGKTSLVTRFCDNMFLTQYIDTIGVDYKSKIIKLRPDFVDDNFNNNNNNRIKKRNSKLFNDNNNNSTIDNESIKVRLQIWDTTSSLKYPGLTLPYYRNSDAIFVIFDVTNRSSFESIKKWMKIINENCKNNVEVYLIANKCDISNIGAREVTQNEIELLSSSYGIKYYEISVKENKCVDKLFYEVTKSIRKNNEIKKQQSKNEDIKEIEEKSFIKRKVYTKRNSKINSKRKVSNLLNPHTLLSCFLCNTRQLPEHN